MAPKDTSPKTKLWKDEVNRKLVTRISEVIGSVEKSFDRAGFVEAVMGDGFLKKELKDRINTIARHYRDFLPADYSRTVDILIKVAPNLKEWSNWTLTSYVEQFGLDHFDDSVRAMKELTKHGTSEFAIRPFVIKYTDRMLKVMNEWALDTNDDVRRLAAEGSRPRGVWVAHVDAFKEDPRPVLDLLEKLKADNSLYVRKAVSNNLNDISKEHPDLVINTGKRWLKDKNKHTDWIIKHACRSLIKDGHPEVFELFGFTADPKIEVGNLKVSKKKIKIGDEITFSFGLTSTARETQNLVVDYKVHYQKSGGKKSAKVFKLTQKSIAAAETLSLSTRHSFEERSTRKHFPGEHIIELMVNGVSHGTVSLNLAL